MLRKSKFTNIHFQNEGWEDLSFWCLLLKQIPYAYGINQSLAFYRIVSGSRSNNKLFSAKLMWRTLRQVENKNLFSTSYYFFYYALTGFLKHKSF